MAKIPTTSTTIKAVVIVSKPFNLVIANTGNPIRLKLTEFVSSLFYTLKDVSWTATHGRYTVYHVRSFVRYGEMVLV